jgi:quinol monooxygenase YgiN
MDRSNPSVVVAGYVKVALKHREAFVKVCSARPKENGCIAYAFAVDVVDPNVARMSEAWRDQQSLETHLADDDFQGVRKELMRIEFIERSVQRYNVSSVTDI